MTDGTSQGLFIVVAIVIFGIFVVLAYILFEDTLSPAMASMFGEAFETAVEDIETKGLRYAEETDFEYVTDGHTITITNYIGNDTSFAIPETIDGKPVTQIARKSFANRGLIEVKLPETLVTIGVTNYGGSEETYIGGTYLKETYLGAFAYNPDLKRISIPDSVVFIGNSTFFNCKSLAQVNFGTGLEEIHPDAFTGTALRKIVFPDSLKLIGTWAFHNVKLEKVTFGKNLMTVNYGAFHGTNLTEVTLPESLKTIENLAFSKTNIKTVTIPDSVTSLHSGAFNADTVIIR